MAKIYLISLKKDKVRRDELKKRFPKNYDKFELIDAIDGRTMSAKEYYAIAINTFKKLNKFLSPAEVGCSLSHIMAYEEFLKSDDEFALVFEDDVIGDDNGIEIALKNAKKMPKNGVLICGGQDGYEGRYSAFGKKLDVNFYHVAEISQGAIVRTCAYIISKESANAILQKHKNTLNIADAWTDLIGENSLHMYYSEIFAHPLDLKDSNISVERDSRGLGKPTFNDYLNSAKFIIKSRLLVVFSGYERIFKR